MKSATFVKNQKGFTLIELLVVMGILAVLLAIVLIAINPARQFQQANDRKRLSDINAILNAYGAYAADNAGKLPTGLTAIPGEMTFTDCKALTGTPSYIAAIPTDPNLGTSPVTNANCGSAGTITTNYFVSVDGTGKVTVSAQDAQLSTPMSVTR